MKALDRRVMFLEILKKKVDCSVCGIRLNDGKQVLVQYSPKMKVKGYFCSDNCATKV